MLYSAIRDGIPVYGVSTGFGKSCGQASDEGPGSLKHRRENLIRFHGCGTGDPISIFRHTGGMLCRLLVSREGIPACH